MSKKETKPEGIVKRSRRKIKAFWQEHKSVRFLAGLTVVGIPAIACIKTFVKNSEKEPPTEYERLEHMLSYMDIDDEELLELVIDDPAFREEYNVSDEEYAMLKEKFSNDAEEDPE